MFNSYEEEQSFLAFCATLQNIMQNIMKNIAKRALIFTFIKFSFIQLTFFQIYINRFIFIFKFM